MGWDVTNIGNKSGFGEYNLADGTTYKVDDTTARYALNQQKKLEEITGPGGVSDAAIADFAQLTEKSLDVDNMKEYLEYRKEYYKVAQDTYNLTDAQVEELLNESDAVGELAKTYDLATEMSVKFNNNANPDSTYYEEMADVLSGLSEEELDIALNVLDDSASLDEFTEKYQRALFDAEVQSWNDAAEQMKTIMGEAAEAGSFSESNMNQLQNDEDFMAMLEEQGIAF
jgi:hypothetical protein